MRRLQLRQRGFRPQGTPVTPKVVDTDVVDTKVVTTDVVTPKKKKETVMTKVKKAVKKII